jgi:hypothetical protein
MAERKRVEIGLGIGQGLTVRLTDDELKRFREQVERSAGWFDLETDEGPVALNLATVVYVKVASPHTIGFSGE